MAKQNIPLLAFNRGLVDAKALARVDIDRTRLSASQMNNWIPKTQGAMRIAPGTKYFGSGLNDTGAEFIEFVASTDDVALLELTSSAMRVWLGSDAHNLSLMERPAVDTTLTLTDTGWSNASTGGSLVTPAVDVIPTMTGATTDNVKITASSENTNPSETEGAWSAAVDDDGERWLDTGEGSALPSWWNVDFDAAGSDTGNYQAITAYSVQSANTSVVDLSPKAWRLITGNHDTGTHATDTGKWTLVDERSSQTGWAPSEKRTFTRADTDTGTVEVQRHWRLYFTQVDNNGSDTGELQVGEIEMFTASTPQQVKLLGGRRVFNATSIGALAKLQKQVVVDTGDVDVEHGLAINVTRGPIIFRVGSTSGDDDYVSEATLGTGYHNLAFTPSGNFHVTLQTDAIVNRIVGSLAISDTGTVSVVTPWTANDIDNIRYDQSADVVYVDCDGVKPHKIERRGTGRSWSVVEYAPVNGPFLAFASSSARLSVSEKYGNTSLNSDIPFFRNGHVGALVRLFHNGQSGLWPLGALDAATDAIEVTGIHDTGTTQSKRERYIEVTVSGTYTGRITIQRSFDGEDVGFKDTDFTDTGAVAAGGSLSFEDPDDNVKVWYRAKMTDYTSGAALVRIAYKNGGTTGVGRVTAFNSNTDVDFEVLSRFSDTGPTESWQQGAWSELLGYPSSVALHGGRLAHAGGANVYLSVSDDFENFDDNTTGDAGPISRTLGSGPVDKVYYLVSLLRLIIGTAGAEISLRSSSLDEILTPTNNSAKKFSTQGSKNLRSIEIDNSAIFVQRSGRRLFSVGFGSSVNAAIDYQASELTKFVPELLTQGVVSIAVQRQPDTRIHCVLGDGTVGILTYDPTEDLLCWSTWSTLGSVEKNHGSSGNDGRRGLLLHQPDHQRRDKTLP